MALVLFDRKELQNVMLVDDLVGIKVNSSTFSVAQVSLSAETHTLGRIQTLSFSSLY